jgi:hypothetical protein
MSSSGKAQLKNSNCKRVCTKIATKKTDIEYDNTIASDYEQCQEAVCLGYVNLQGIPR